MQAVKLDREVREILGVLKVCDRQLANVERAAAGVAKAQNIPADTKVGWGDVMTVCVTCRECASAG
jgi:hypothetical protein